MMINYLIMVDRANVCCSMFITMKLSNVVTTIMLFSVVFIGLDNVCDEVNQICVLQL